MFLICILFLQYFTQTTVFAEEISVKSIGIGQSQQGRPVVVERFGHGPDALVLMASIHGNETIGTALFNQLIDHLYTHPELLHGRTVYIMRLSNPDGMVEEIRGNSDNIDINRNFPTQNFGRGWFNGDEPLTAPEASILRDFFLQLDPVRVLTIHQPLNGIDYDGPAKQLAQTLSEASGIRIHRLGSRSGSLGSFVGKDLERPIITLEIPEYASDQSSTWLWKTYGPFLEAFIVYDPSN